MTPHVTSRHANSALHSVSMETRYVAATEGCDDRIRGDSQLWPGRRPARGVVGGHNAANVELLSAVWD